MTRDQLEQLERAIEEAAAKAIPRRAGRRIDICDRSPEAEAERERRVTESMASLSKRGPTPEPMQLAGRGYRRSTSARTDPAAEDTVFMAEFKAMQVEQAKAAEQRCLEADRLREAEERCRLADLGGIRAGTVRTVEGVVTGTRQVRLSATLRPVL